MSIEKILPKLECTEGTHSTAINTYSNLDKYIWEFEQIHFTIWTKTKNPPEKPGWAMWSSRFIWTVKLFCSDNQNSALTVKWHEMHNWAHRCVLHCITLRNFAFLNQYTALNIHYTLYIHYTFYSVWYSHLHSGHCEWTSYIVYFSMYNIQYTHLNSLRMDIIHCTIVQL